MTSSVESTEKLQRTVNPASEKSIASGAKGEASEAIILSTDESNSSLEGPIGHYQLLEQEFAELVIPPVLTTTNQMLGIIADEDTCAGFALAGAIENRVHHKTNFLVVYPDTPVEEIKRRYFEFLWRKDIAIIVIDQSIADNIRNLINKSFRYKHGSVVELKPVYKDYDYFKDIALQMVGISSLRKALKMEPASETEIRGL